MNGGAMELLQAAPYWALAGGLVYWAMTRLWRYERDERPFQFGRMIAAIGIDPRRADNVLPDVALADAGRICLRCRHQARCERWLAAATTGTIPDFCPNAQRLRIMKQRTSDRATAR